MAASYSNYSPYLKTDTYGNYLDVANIIDIPANVGDVSFKVNKTYQYRPDLLAYDLYGSTELWWVFAVRNPNVIKDPVFDLRPGVEIFLPKKETLTNILG